MSMHAWCESLNEFTRLYHLSCRWTHQEQPSVPMSEEEYMDKLDTICFYLRYKTKTYEPICSSFICLGP